MDKQEDTPPPGGQIEPDADLLEGSSLETAPDSGVAPAPTVTDPGASSPAPEKSPRGSLLNRWRHGNLYLVIFIVILLVSIGIIAFLYMRSKHNASNSKSPTISTQNLSAEALQQLANNNGLQVGDAKQVLNIQSNAVFAGAVLVRGDLQVAGSIKTGGSLNLTGLSVSGLGSFSKVQTQDLAVAGSGSFTGQLSTQGALSVGGGGSFGGPVTTPALNTNTLQLAGNLVLNNHIQAGGPRPGASGAGALGSGGTTSISGSDTAGTIAIHTGGGPSAGCFTTVRFARAFSSPRVIVTPIGSAAGSLDWYVNRSGSSFSVCTRNAAPAGQNFAFDYFVVD